MLVYSKILFCLGIFNITSCTAFSLLFFVYPEKFSQGTIINNIAFLIGVIGFFLMMILTAIYYIKLGEQRENLITFNPFTITLYILFGINVVLRLFFDKNLSVLGSATPAKIVTTLDLALFLNLTVVIMSFNYIKLKLYL